MFIYVVYLYSIHIDVTRSEYISICSRASKLVRYYRTPTLPSRNNQLIYTRLTRLTREAHECLLVTVCRPTCIAQLVHPPPKAISAERFLRYSL